MQPDGQRGPAQALPRAGRRASGSGPGVGPGPGAGGPGLGEHDSESEVELLLNRKEIRGVLHYRVRWRGHTSADDEWLRAARELPSLRTARARRLRARASVVTSSRPPRCSDCNY